MRRSDERHNFLKLNTWDLPVDLFNQVDGPHQQYCSECGQDDQEITRLSHWEPHGRHVVVHLSVGQYEQELLDDFQLHGSSYAEQTEAVLRWLDSQSLATVIKLRSVVLYRDDQERGGRSGHYIALALSGDGTWVAVNDSTVSKLPQCKTLRDVLQRLNAHRRGVPFTPVVLVFERKVCISCGCSGRLNFFQCGFLCVFFFL